MNIKLSTSQAVPKSKDKHLAFLLGTIDKKDLKNAPVLNPMTVQVLEEKENPKKEVKPQKRVTYQEKMSYPKRMGTQSNTVL